MEGSGKLTTEHSRKNEAAENGSLVSFSAHFTETARLG
jgi:hypothetical protein